MQVRGQNEILTLAARAKQVDLWPVWWETGVHFALLTSGKVRHQSPIKQAINHPIYIRYSYKNPSLALSDKAI